MTFYEGPGCFECGGTGFRGRSAITELLDLERTHPRTDPGQAAGVGNPTQGSRRGACRRCAKSALEKAKDGHTTLKEINKVTFIEV